MFKEVTIFSYGDSNDLSTWSNVPFFLAEALENKNIKLNRVNVIPNRLVRVLWNKVVLSILRLFFKDTTYTFERTPFFRFLVNIKMWRTVKKFNNTDIFIAISFSFHPKKFTNKPVVMFCDWTYDYYFDYFKKREPDILERQEIKNQYALQKSVDAMFVLFPDVCTYVKEKGICKNVFYLGNVVNSKRYFLTVDTIKKKYNNNEIIFIGSSKYLPGLKILVSVFLRLSDSFPSSKLNIIGITKKELKVNDERINFLGYLNKSNEHENSIYYDSVNKAKVFVNTTPEWASFSAALDVMYHFTPVITSQYRSFQETFGNSINFGLYSSNDKDELEEKLNEILGENFDSYKKRCLNARNAVEPFSWDTYVKKMLSVTSSVIKN